MPAFVAWILSGLLSIAGSLVGRVLLALGFGFVEYTGISLLVDQAKQGIETAFAGFTSSAGEGILQWAGFFRIDVHLSIVLSAIGVKMMLSALTGDKVRRLVQK